MQWPAKTVRDRMQNAAIAAVGPLADLACVALLVSALRRRWLRRPMLRVGAVVIIGFFVIGVLVNLWPDKGADGTTDGYRVLEAVFPGPV